MAPKLMDNRSKGINSFDKVDKPHKLVETGDTNTKLVKDKQPPFLFSLHFKIFL
jgi:hypothetical protein